MLFPMKLAVLLMTASLAFAADRSVDAVKAAEKAWAAATISGDEPALRNLLADDLMYTHSNGDTDTKAVFVSNLKDGTRKYHKLEHENMDVRLYGDTAVVAATAQIATASKGGAPSPAHLRFLHVWVWKSGRWQLAAHQSLRLPN